MKGFYNLLYGLLDTNKLSSILRFDVTETIYDSDGNIVNISIRPDNEDHFVQVIYGIRRDSLTDEQWDKLLISLRRDTYKTILSDSINAFTVTENLPQCKIVGAGGFLT